MSSFLSSSSSSFSSACSYSSSLLFLSNPGCDFLCLTPKPKVYYTRRRRTTKPRLPIIRSSSSSDTTKLVTFLGKGGSGKTTAAVFAAQHYAMAGLRTCLVIQTQDPTADFLLSCKIGTSPTICNDNLSAVRLETTKLLLEPLDRLKQADARLKMTQGVLEGVVGEELGVLPAMDSIFGAFVLARRVGLLRNVTQDNNLQDGFDVVIYDGMSSDETLRMVGAASKGRLYLKYLRNLAEKTDLGRVIGPSLLGLVDEAMNLNGSGSYGRMSSDVWDTLEKMLEKGSSVFYDPGRFSCFLVMDPNNPISVESALRYWGCTIQSGAQVSGAIRIGSPHSDNASDEVRKKFSPLPFTLIPHLAIGHPLDWNSVMLDAASQDAKTFFSSRGGSIGDVISPVKFDVAKRSITLFMPGFDKPEIKLYQYRGGSELLVEAGDQRRVICLPPRVQGKVAGAKFSDRSLLITMR